MDNVIKEERRKHIMAVAQYMYNLASPEKRDEMYILGMLHDIGYLFGAENHNKSGGELLQKQQYKYWQEVYYHGDVDPPYKSDELDLLNTADMSIDSHGNNVGFEKRLEDIRKRYGCSSNQYSNAEKIIRDLISKKI